MIRKMLSFVMIACVLISGCQLAKKEVSNSTKEDELMGVFITFKSIHKDTELSDEDINEILNGGGSSAKEDDRIYATKIPDKEDDECTFEFKGVKGIPFYYAEVYEKNGNYMRLVLSDEIYVEDNNIGNMERNLKGNIFIDSTLKKIIFINPVYETSDGQIYNIPAAFGMSLSDEPSQEYLKTITKTTNGETVKFTSKVFFSVNRIDPKKYIFIKQFSENDVCLSSTKITKNHIPKSIKKDLKTEYIIAETHCLNSEKKFEIKREVIDLSENTYDCMLLNDKGFGVHYPILIQ